MRRGSSAGLAPRAGGEATLAGEGGGRPGARTLPCVDASTQARPRLDVRRGEDGAGAHLPEDPCSMGPFPQQGRE